MKNNSLTIEIWKYFLIFSVTILGFLWIFQVLFFNQYYRYAKTLDIKEMASLISKNYNNNNLEGIINTAAYDNEVCVEITDSSFKTLYSSTIYGKGCFTGKNVSANYKFDFITSGLNKKTYELVNPSFKNDILVYAVKLKNNNYAFINTSLEPMDGAISILRKQLIVVTIIVFVLSFVISYFISNFISSPIVKMSKSAKELAKGNFNVKFNTDSNIHEIDELAETLNYTSSELSKTDEYRRDLMANVSHDLKTPLTMIKAYAEMSVDLHDKDKKKRIDDVKVITEEVDRLTGLVNDILDLSKMQSNIDNLVYEEFDIVSLCNDIIDRYSILKETEDYIFKLKTSSKKIVVYADRKKMEQVIYNLINNAINYTGEDKTVKVNVFEKDFGVLVQVIDSGKGIKESDIPYIWDRYYKNKKKHKRNLVGTGLGLSIVKNILELHEFKYGVDSSINKGSSFYFVITKKDKN